MLMVSQFPWGSLANSILEAQPLRVAISIGKTSRRNGFSLLPVLPKRVPASTGLAIGRAIDRTGVLNFSGA
jgi:hypothetical protein